MRKQRRVLVDHDQQPTVSFANQAGVESTGSTEARLETIRQLLHQVDPDAIVNLPCPKCGEKTPQTVAELQSSPRIRCGKCGSMFGVSYAKIMKKLEEAQAKADAQRRGF